MVPDVQSIREYQNFPNSYLLFTKVSMHLSISHSLCRRSSRSPIMLSILLVLLNCQVINPRARMQGYCSRSVGRSVCVSVCVSVCSHVFSRTVAAVDTKRGYVGMCNGRSAQQESGTS